MPVAAAAQQCGIDKRTFVDAVARGQMGDVRLLQIGERQFVQGPALMDFLDQKRGAGQADASFVEAARNLTTNLETLQALFRSLIEASPEEHFARLSEAAAEIGYVLTPKGGRKDGHPPGAVLGVRA